MKQLKKTLLTLVALIAVTTGAWAQTGENIFQYCYDCQRNPAYPKTTASASLSDFANPLVGYKGSGFEAGNTSDGPWKLEYMGLWSTTDKHGIEDFRVSNYQDTYNCTDVPVFRLYQWNATANEYQHASYGVVCAYAKVSNAVEHTAFFEAADGWGCVLTNSSHSSSMNITFDEDLTTGLTTLIAAATPAASGTPVDLTRGTGEKINEWTLTNGMPAGNVTLEPEYYPQATLTAAPTAADGAKATTDDLLVSGGTVATITGSDPAAPQGTLMYYVSLTNMSTEALLALDADKWVAEPTAAGITQKCGAFVYYYVKGNDSTDDALNFSDGDISSANVLNVPIYPAPLWNAEFDLTNAPEEDKAGKWSTDIPEGGVVKGTPVTVTYTGDRKVIGVKAEKKAAPAETTVTLTTGEIGDLTSWGSTSKTINGITIAVSGDAHFFTTGYMEVSAYDGETGDPIPTTGTYTFTSSVGKIKRIDINHNGGKWWGSGDGWPGSYNVFHSSTFTWSGTPAASVTLYGSGNDMDNCTFDVSSFVFTIEPTN